MDWPASLLQSGSHYTRNESQAAMKHRNIPYRIRSLQNLRRWSTSFSGCFPSSEDLAENPRYWNWKIPVCSTLVEGENAAPEIQRECAQLLIDACARLMRAKPPGRSDLRVTCSVALPDMFTSELCIYLQESYFLGHTTPDQNDFGEIVALNSRSLANEWGLNLPQGVLERGLHVNYPARDTHESLIGDRWFFGEVAT